MAFKEKYYKQTGELLNLSKTAFMSSLAPWNGRIDYQINNPMSPNNPVKIEDSWVKPYNTRERLNNDALSLFSVVISGGYHRSIEISNLTNWHCLIGQGMFNTVVGQVNLSGLCGAVIKDMGISGMVNTAGTSNNAEVNFSNCFLRRNFSTSANGDIYNSLIEKYVNIRSITSSSFINAENARYLDISKSVVKDTIFTNCSLIVTEALKNTDENLNFENCRFQIGSETNPTLLDGATSEARRANLT